MTAAEQQEHRERRPESAAAVYARAAAQATTAGQRLEALNGQARTELKAGHPTRALETYKKLIAAANTLDGEQARWAVIARHQVVSCYELIDSRPEYADAALDLYRFLIDHRFILGDDE
ncbi:MAG: hypothetical protein HY654_02460, partial [Acidobacteria bacterium]|nr:hypothetical protein [Acidobacteriota bacterium]